jgi:alkylation response protein AidB-like acyl-CoA dehydrogenase
MMEVTNMLNNVRITEESLYDLRMKTRQVVEHDLEALSAEMEKTNVYPKAMWDICRKNDLFRLSLPTQYGGMGLCLEQYFTVLEEIGRGNQAIRMYLHVANGLSWEIMAEHGSEELKNAYLPKMGTGEFFCRVCADRAGLRFRRGYPQHRRKERR